MRQYLRKMAAIMFSLACALIGPVHAYLTKGVFSSTVEARIPFTERDSNTEFVFNMGLQVLIGCHGAFAYIGMESYLSILENTVTITPILVELDIMRTIEQYENKLMTQLQLDYKILQLVYQSIDADE